MTEFLSSSDEFMWAIGDDPVLRPTIVTLTVLKRCPDWDDVLNRFDRISRAAPRFRQIVRRSTPPLPPRWELDPDFDLSFHVRRQTVRNASWGALLDLARLAAMADYDDRHPRWEATLVEGLPAGTAALLCKLDHALTDGVGAVELADTLYDRSELPCDLGPMPPVPTATQSGTIRRTIEYEARLVAAVASALTDSVPGALRSARHAVRSAVKLSATATSMLRTARPMSGPRSPIMLNRTPIRYVSTHEVDKSDLLRAGHIANGSLNDAFIAGIAGGLRRYHEAHQAPVTDLVVSMPISIRTRTDPAAGNRATLMRFQVPVGVADPARRIRVIHERTGQARHEKSLGHTGLIAAGLNVIPRWYVSNELRRVDFIASDVPGFPSPVSLAGAPVGMQYAFSPTMGAALNVTMFSYLDTCAVGINVDVGAVPDYHVFHDCLVEGFDEVLKLAT